MEGLFRRSSGVYVARLVVPQRLRAAIGKSELIASTGTSVLAVARIVGGELLTCWRRRFIEMDSITSDMNLFQVVAGSPLLKLDGYLPPPAAEGASGIPVDELLRMASNGRLSLFFAAGGVDGHIISSDELTIDRPTGERIVPSPAQMSELATFSSFTGALAVRDSPLVASMLLSGAEPQIVLLNLVGQRDRHFVPLKPLHLTRNCILFERPQVEAVRQSVAKNVSPGQLAVAKAALAQRNGVAVSEKGARTLSAAVVAFIKDHESRWAPDYTRRVRAACELYVELMGDCPVREIDRERLRQFRDEILSKVPANENKIRLTHGTTSVSASMQAVAGTGWPTLSNGECVKRMQWLSLLFAWLHEEKWLADDPAVGLGAQRRRHDEKKAKAQSPREVFSEEDLGLVFGAVWFKQGRGKLTAKGTYREFCPYYYWLPLLGLYTGARINELCQLSLSDIRTTAKGTLFIDINDEEARKKLKTTSAVRSVPVHPHLQALGFGAWCDHLRTRGFARLFPELRHDEVKGYSKAAVKWFSAHLKRLGIERDNTKVFHSFRHGLTTFYEQELRLPLSVVRTLGGWSRGNSVAESTYRHDEEPDRLAAEVARVRFPLPPIALFDIDAGLVAAHDALARKDRGHGRAED